MHDFHLTTSHDLLDLYTICAEECGLSRKEICRRAGVDQAMLNIFLRDPRRISAVSYYRLLEGCGFLNRRPTKRKRPA